MRIKPLIFIIIFFAATLIHKQSFAQSFSLSNIQNIQVSQLSDEQITQIWKKFQDARISETDGYKLMADKGIPSEQIDALKQRFTALGLNNKSNKKTFNKSAKEDIDFSRDSNNLVVKPMPAVPKPLTAATAIPAPLPVFGLDFFTQTAVRFEPNLNLATPKGYVLGPGDEVIVLVTGLNESSVKSKISPEGNLKIPYGGLIYVNGFTIEQTTALVRKSLLKVYPGLNSGQTQLTVNLGNTRSIRVTILGEVKIPGSYTISSLSTLFNALYNSGGPNTNGSLRYIELIRNNRIYKIVDFYNFLQHGYLSDNIRLEDQDVVRIPVYHKRVSITGEIKRPAIYELKENEQLDDLIAFAGGYTDIAYKGIAKIEQITTIEREVKDVPANLFSNFIPRNGDVVSIGAITNRFANRVVLEGAVYRPGPYELTAGLSLSALLKLAKGLKPEAYKERGYIKRTLPSLEKRFESFSPLDIINGKNDIALLREDTVVIQDESTFVSQQMISVNGFVREPSKFIYRKGMKLADVIAMAGGFSDQAARQHVDINRIIKNTQDSVANQLVKRFTVDMTTNANDNIELEPSDYIFVQRLVNYRTLGNVSIKGEVLFPGDYAVERRDETALDFLQTAGGLTPYGSLENAQVYRKGIRVNLDLTKKPETKIERESMTLLAGDSVFIPRVITFVEVTGEVNNPQLISYENNSFKYYINAAGGTTSKARLKGAYIKYPNGLNRPVRHFLFFRNYPEVKPGSKIIVPVKDPSIKIGFGDIAGIASALTALIGLIALLRTTK